MKSFYLSLLIFALLLGAITLNGRYLANVSDRLSDAVERIPDFGEEDVEDPLRRLRLDEAREIWRRESETVAYFVTVRVTEGIEDAFGSLSASLAHGDRAGFDAARDHLLRIAQDLRRYGRPDLASFF